ncbi:riboflavin synthase [Thermogemmatispora sp.]|uniref:riboflavin synthase n=1 Tax=Thermogemmatispora sp. TaxID=1968838 RepID=UPI001E16D832|nr:riboflavin synthase [Thermogemmatispora sp.]MBX5449829.1 riboflavin synthase [Thermogemmatispora sp.]
MFTGIVEAVGDIIAASATALEIVLPTNWPEVQVGDSIAVDGACLTVVARGEHWLRVELMPETLRRTRFATLIREERSGQDERAVNLERSLPVGGRFGGHIVQGHVEAVVPVLSTHEEGNSLVCEIALPAALRPYIVPKGFVALNGVSLTVVTCQDDRFSIALIPYTRFHTNLGRLRPGCLLNLESDIVGRYLVQLLGRYPFAEQSRQAGPETGGPVDATGE